MVEPEWQGSLGLQLTDWLVIGRFDQHVLLLRQSISDMRLLAEPTHRLSLLRFSSEFARRLRRDRPQPATSRRALVGTGPS